LESPDQKDRLKRSLCQAIQGPLVAPAARPGEILSLVARINRSASVRSVLPTPATRAQ
jgi:hypothetical protein